MTVEQSLAQAQSQLKVEGISSPALDSQLLLTHITRQSREWLMAHPEAIISHSEQRQFFALIKQRAKRTPLSQLTGYREFFGLKLKVTPAVLTPRIETEKIAELAIMHAPANSKLIDIGTGCGALAVAIAKHRPDLEVWATEISDTAMAVARQNAKLHNLKIHFVLSDLFTAPSLHHQSFQTAVTNLPYLPDSSEIMPEVAKEPAIALFGGPDGLDIYRRFLRQLPGYLNGSGLLFTECDPWQQAGLISHAAEIGLKVIEEDYFVLGFKRQNISPSSSSMPFE
jgi:release factor glutamine methyltransferase